MAAAALGLCAIPIIIHLISRRRYVRVPWAAMTFLLRVTRKSARRVRLEQWLLLFLRVAVIVLLGLAIARPFLSGSSFMGLAGSRSHRIIVIDNSFSMNAMAAQGGTLFDNALIAARELLSTFPQADAISLVTMAAPATAVIGRPAFDRRMVRDALSTVMVTQRTSDVVGALNKTVELLNESDAASENRSVYLISMLPARSWTADRGGLAPAAATALRRVADALSKPKEDLNLIRVSPRDTHNAAVVDLRVGKSLVTTGIGVRLEATIRNFSQSTMRNLTVQFRYEGEILRHEPLGPLEPGASTVVRTTTVFSTPGTSVVEARLVSSMPDVLELDNSRYLSLEVRETSHMLLVDGQPGPRDIDGKCGYFATAIAPRVSATDVTIASPKIVSEAEFDSEALSDYDVVILCGVERLAVRQWNALDSFVQQGGGLLITAGGLVSIENYNRYGYNDGNGLIPGKFTAKAEGADAALAIQHTDLTHPIVAAFVDHISSGLFLAWTTGHLVLEPDLDRSEVALRFDNNDPALVLGTWGNGRVAVWTTSVDMSWTNLPAKGDFVPLALNLVSHLAAKHGRHRNLIVGDDIREPLAPGEGSMELRVSTGAATSLEPTLVAVGDGLALSAGPIEAMGVVDVRIGDVVRRFAVNVDTGESDLSVGEAAEIASATERPFRFVADASLLANLSVKPRSTELASLVLLVVMGLLIAEMYLAHRLGSVRASASASVKTSVVA